MSTSTATTTIVKPAPNCDCYTRALQDARAAGVPWSVILAMHAEGLWPDEVDLTRYIPKGTP